MQKHNFIPRISCIHCRKEYSVKGIFTHYFASHDPNGINVMAAVRKKGTDVTFRDPKFINTNKKLPKEKEKHLCTNSACSELTVTKYCSKRCAAVINNSKRTTESRRKQAITLLENKHKSGWLPKDISRIPTPLKKRTCVICNKVDETKGHFQSDKCNFCSDSLTYRNACSFTFNLKDFPEEFDLALLTEHGMFNPKTNQKGVSRDHMLSVNYGKMNRIDPKIISHPANCRLMLQADNKAKQHYSSITLPELLNLIQIWDSKYR